MRNEFRSLIFLALSLLLVAIRTPAQAGNAGAIDGLVKDQSGGVIPDATVEINNPVSGYSKSTRSGADGSFHFANVPFNPYHLTVSAAGFAAYAQEVEVRTGVPVKVEAG